MDPAANGYGVFPYAGVGASGNVRYAYKSFAWGTTFETGSGSANAQLQFHQFPCSKCHNPHASKLPRLLITNCLDVRFNTWDDLFVNDGDWTGGEANGAPMNWSTQVAFGTKEFAYAKSAQNCHRRADKDGNSTYEEPGWNYITPGFAGP